MKKLLISFILLGFIFINGCAGKAIEAKADACETASTNFSTALDAYVADFNNKSKCQAYLEAAKKLINNCTTLSAASRKAANDAIANTKCD